MSFMALAGAIGAGATAIGASGAIAGVLGTTAATVAPVLGGIGAGLVGGAGLGALSSAITGGDVGKGALFGALGGGLTGGLGSAIGGMGGAAGATGAGASTAAGGTASAAGNVASNLATNVAPTIATSGTGGIMPGSVINAMGGNIAGAVPASAGVGITGNAVTAPIAGAVGSGAGMGTTALPASGLYSGAVNPSFFSQNPVSTIMLGSSLGNALQGFTEGPTSAMPAGYDTGAGPLEFYKFRPRRYRASQPMYIKPASYADGGIASLNPDSDMMQSGPAQVDFMGEDAYPMSQQKLHFYSTPTQMPTSAQQAMASYEPSTNPLTGQPISHFDKGGITQIPVGGKLLRGPGDGVSDDIRANIEGRQEARLADGEYVVPARAVSELGNGSTDAGAKKLSAMVDRIQQGRRKSMGRKKIAVDSKAHRAMPV